MYCQWDQLTSSEKGTQKIKEKKRCQNYLDTFEEERLAYLSNSRIILTWSWKGGGGFIPSACEMGRHRFNLYWTGKGLLEYQYLTKHYVTVAYLSKWAKIPIIMALYPLQMSTWETNSWVESGVSSLSQEDERILCLRGKSHRQISRNLLRSVYL